MKVRIDWQANTVAHQDYQLTLDLAGQARFGPDVEWLSDARSAQLPGAELDYAVDASRAAAFAREIRRYWPRLADGALAPAYSGIRP